MRKPLKKYKRELFYPAGTRELTDEDLGEMYDVNDPLGKELYEMATKSESPKGYSIPTREDGTVPWNEVYDEVIADDWRKDRPEAQHWTREELHEAVIIGISLIPEIIIPFIQKYGPDFGFSQEDGDFNDDNKEQVLLAMDEITEVAKPTFLSELRRLKNHEDDDDDF